MIVECRAPVIWCRPVRQLTAWWSSPGATAASLGNKGSILSTVYTVPKIIDFPRNNTKYSGKNEMLREIFCAVSRFPLHFVLYLGNLDYILNSVYIQSRLKRNSATRFASPNFIKMLISISICCKVFAVWFWFCGNINMGRNKMLRSYVESLNFWLVTNYITSCATDTETVVES